MGVVLDHPGEIFENVEALVIFEGMEEAAPRAFGEEEGFAFLEDRFQFGAVGAFAGCDDGSEVGVAAGFAGGRFTEM